MVTSPVRGTDHDQDAGVADRRGADGGAGVDHSRSGADDTHRTVEFPAPCRARVPSPVLIRPALKMLVTFVTRSSRSVGPTHVDRSRYFLDVERSTHDGGIARRGDVAVDGQQPPVPMTMTPSFSVKPLSTSSENPFCQEGGAEIYWPSGWLFATWFAADVNHRGRLNAIADDQRPPDRDRARKTSRARARRWPRPSARCRGSRCCRSMTTRHRLPRVRLPPVPKHLRGPG